MARKSNKKRLLQEQIAELEIRKRNGLMRAVAAFVGLAVIIAVKLSLEGQGVEWASSTFANLGLFVLAVVAAGVAGMGTRAWRKSRDQIQTLKNKCKK